MKRSIAVVIAFLICANYRGACAEEQRAVTNKPPSLVVYFRPGSSSLSKDDNAILDKASLAYNEGRPIVMVLTGSSDTSGDARQNLILSQQRAAAVLRGLLDRGIPAERFQILAKGETELPVPTTRGIAEGKNRRVGISWH